MIALPVELWFSVIDALGFDKATLTACLTVCRTFHSRALQHLMRHLELSQVSSTKTCHADPAALLDLLESQPDTYNPLPRRFSINCLEFTPTEHTIKTRALRLLPQFSNLGQLHLQNLDLSAADAPTILKWSFPSIHKLALDGCHFDARSLTTFLSRFSSLAELRLASCVTWTEKSGDAELPWSDCILDLMVGRGYDSTDDGSFKWAAQHRKHFLFRSLHLTTLYLRESVLEERLKVIGSRVRGLFLDVSHSVNFAVQAQSLRHAAFTVSMCTALETLDLRCGYTADVLLFETIPPSCRLFRVHVTYLSRTERSGLMPERWIDWTAKYNIPEKILLHGNEVIASVTSN
ncbi:hypothetical protein EXIGLDRAFT_769860 [Exidia glandulosa HHB12029]|uniref:F-box domain-containing protein n=1 Tax=Exidia glandulosa HHB12029 TaxID=1314781 RepID=A0A165H693_EXIGL|nr:hypothetical protein EXIGLDRAFT_769860 [Exidia glandulosa HHB12029]